MAAARLGLGAETRTVTREFGPWADWEAGRLFVLFRFEGGLVVGSEKRQVQEKRLPPPLGLAMNGM